jgi:cystathionine beta-lyase
MKYDFESILDRKGKDALAIDMLGKMPGVYPGGPKEGFDPIPMWVADMNFKTLPNIQEEIIKRVEHPAFGYFVPRKEYFSSIIDWQEKRNGVKNLKKENIGYENGVLGGVISALNIFCSKGDKVLLHSPTYIGFTKSLENNGYHIVHSDLIKDENGKWVMDYQDMEKKIIENNITVSIICNPHNPSGRVWTKEELEKAMEIYQKHHVYLISDEIWSDILINGHKYTPTQSVNDYARENTIALYAPSKTFNLAGLIGAYHIVYNDYLKKRLVKESSLSHYNSMNVLSMYALIGAYKKEGHDRVDQLNQVLSENVNFAYDFIKENFKGVDLYKPQGTYMLFLDLEEYCKESGKSLDQIIEKGWDHGVIWQDGRPFNGKYAIRMNLALPKTRVEEAFQRLKDYVFV